MTIWKAGMLAVCIKGEPCTDWITDDDERPIIYPVTGEIYMVTETGRDDGIKWLCFAEFPSDYAFAASEFRPAVQSDAADDAEMIAKIRRCKPARQPVEA